MQKKRRCAKISRVKLNMNLRPRLATYNIYRWWLPAVAIELVLSASIISLVSALALSQIDFSFTKIRIAGLLLGFSEASILLQEDLALTGNGLVQAQNGSASVLLPLDNGHREIRNYTDYSISQADYSLVAKGTIGKDKRPLYLTYAPAITADGIPGSMIWMCGKRHAPAGWVRLPGPTGDNLTDKYLVSVCRNY